MNSSQLKQGPLAPVWMAANYEKKLTKQQFLNTNIVTSSQLLSQPITNSESITLRLSGQLLLGIVRIYSRKTKYLLDDVNDILFKLKNAFKHASGGVLLSSDTNNQTSSSQRTTVTNLNNILLADQVTSFDLFYQDELRFDDDEPQNQSLTIFGQDQSDIQMDMDDSIEYGRFNDFNDANNDMMNEDLDFELDFETNNDNRDDSIDNSIEVGRNASTTIQNDFSLLDLDQDNDKFELGFDLDTPLIEELNSPATPEPNEPLTPPPSEPSRPRKKLVGITEDGILKTNKRKLQVDSEDEVNNGVTIEELQHLQQLQLSGNWRDELVTFKLSDNEKLQLIQDMSMPAGFKKRKIWNINEELSKICTEVSNRENEDQNAHQEEDQFASSFDDFNFDVSLPEFSHQTIDEVDFDDQFTQAQAENESTSSTKKIADIIKLSDGSIKFSEILQVEEQDETPLGLVRKNGENLLNKKKQASKCFFEMLVLATRDCISIKQELGETKTSIGGDITVRSKDNLFTSFV